MVYVANENGKLSVLDDKGELTDTIEVCSNISRMRQCSYQTELVATGGKDGKNNLKITNLANKQVIFSTKNPPNDQLDLEKPIWDTDFGFLGATTIATCSRYGYVRFYDTRKQRRPVYSYQNDKEQIAYNSMACYGSNIFVGSNTGVVRCFDARSLKNVVHTYKGLVGSATCLVTDAAGRYLAVSGLDRYIRVYDVNSTELLYQCYTKTKTMQLLLQEVKNETIDDQLESEEGRSKRSRIEEDPEYEELFDNMQTM